MLNRIILIIGGFLLCTQGFQPTSNGMPKVEFESIEDFPKAIHVSRWEQINQLTTDFIAGDTDQALIGIDFDKVLASEDAIREEISDEYTLADPLIPSVLAEWSAKKYKAVIVTAVCNLFAPWRAHQKQFLGIDFISAINMEGVLDKDSAYRIDVDSGIIYSVYIAGGPALCCCFNQAKKKYCFQEPITFNETLEVYDRHQPSENGLSLAHVMYKTKYPAEKLIINSKGDAIASAIKDGFLNKPRKLVFIDDNINNLREIAEMCEQQNIDCLPIHYEYEQIEN
jgi:hypothetical protein